MSMYKYLKGSLATTFYSVSTNRLILGKNCFCGTLNTASDGYRQTYDSYQANS